jgi:hypothetical protein
MIFLIFISCGKNPNDTIINNRPFDWTKIPQEIRRKCDFAETDGLRTRLLFDTLKHRMAGLFPHTRRTPGNTVPGAAKRRRGIGPGSAIGEGYSEES